MYHSAKSLLTLNCKYTSFELEDEICLEHCHLVDEHCVLDLYLIIRKKQSNQSIEVVVVGIVPSAAADLGFRSGLTAQSAVAISVVDE